MNKNKFLKTTFKIVLLIIVGVNIFNPLKTNAEEKDKYNYTVLAPLPGTTIEKNCPPGTLTCRSNLQTYLPGLFNLLIGLSAVAAVLMIVIGGFQYISSDAIKGKSDGKNRIQNAVIGLVLVIGAWLILATINPNLLKLDLNIETIKVPEPTGSTTQLQPITTAAINSLRSSCGCSATITSSTSGTHNPGSKHYQGLAVDFAVETNLTKFITNGSGSTATLRECQSINKSVGGANVLFIWEPKGAPCGSDKTVKSSNDHWHMQIQ